MKQEEEKCCGGCCWFKHEDTDGFGICYKDMLAYDECNCCNVGCSEYVSQKQARHYQAVLLQANRYRRDQHVPSIYRMPDPAELGKAIDFACQYMRVFSKL